VVDDDVLQEHARRDVLFTGTQWVSGMRSTATGRPVADHLTSLGACSRHPQTSALDWLSAGATGSYGNTTELATTAQSFPTWRS